MESTKDKWAIRIAILSLIVSATALYFQFFYVSDKLTLIRIESVFPENDINCNYQIKILIANSGNRDAVLCSTFIQIDSLPNAAAVPEQQFIFLKPNEIKVLDYSSQIHIGLPDISMTRFIRFSYRKISSAGNDVKDSIVIGSVRIEKSVVVKSELFSVPIPF